MISSAPQLARFLCFYLPEINCGIPARGEGTPLALENLRRNLEHEANGIDIEFLHHGLRMSEVPSGSLVDQRPRPRDPTSLRTSAAQC